MKYIELTEEAQQTARNWYLSQSEEDTFFPESVIEDAVRIGALIGIEIASRQWTNSYGFKGSTPEVYFSGFNSQGDGACFEGSYQYKKGAAKAITKECPEDKDLLQIAKELQEIQKRNFYQLIATTKHSGHYSHSGCMSVDVERDDYKERTSDASDVITSALRDFADWIYKGLEKEYDYITSDGYIAETLINNNYDFDEEGGSL